MAFTDNFNRGSLGANWETVEGTAWVTASSLYLKPGGTYAHSTVRVVGTFPNDQYSEVWTEVNSGAGDISLHHGPAARVGAGGDCYYVYFTLTQVLLYKRISGTSTLVLEGSIYSALAADTFHKVKLVVTGTSMEIFVNDVSKLTTTDGSITAGNPGCHALTGQSSLIPRFDDFNSTDVGGGGGGGSTTINRTLMGVG